jgi:WD40 repeat protein
MTDSGQSIPSVVKRTKPVSAGAPVVAVHFLGRTSVFVLGEETLLFVAPDGAERRVAAHSGGILSTACDGTRILTGGDDGKVVATNAASESETLAADAKHRWIDRVALGPDGALAWSAGKQTFVRTANGEVKSIELPSSAGGLAFAPKGLRLAAAHYGGASLWFPNAQAKPEMLAWKGSHLDALFSPDGKFLVTAMQEPMLHGWRLVDGKDMRMSGYSAKVRSMAWTAGGRWLATSGSEQLILWPFAGKDGPMGKQPRMLAPSRSRAVTVACHPTQEIAAVAFEDGVVLLARIEDGAEILARRGGSPVSALAWSADGSRIAFGTEAGEGGVIDLS